VLDSQLGWLPWRVKRVGGQQQSIGKAWLFRAQYGGLPATIALSTEKNMPGGQLSHRLNSVLQTLTITNGIVRPGRTKGPCLAKRQIAPQYHQAGTGKHFGQRCQHCGFGVPAGPVGEYEAVAFRSDRPMQKPTHRRIDCALKKGFSVRFGHA
jgi:hypothetical protein